MSAESTLLAANVAFAVVFGAFVAAMVVLGFVTMRWAVRRDRVGRRAWLARRSGQLEAGGEPGAVPPASTNGHKPVRPSRPERPPQ